MSRFNHINGRQGSSKLRSKKGLIIFWLLVLMGFIWIVTVKLFFLSKMLLK